MIKRFKKIMITMIVVLCLGGVTACGSSDSSSETTTEESKDLLQQEVDLGTNLKNKAKDNVEKQGEQAGEADDMLDSIPSE